MDVIDLEGGGPLLERVQRASALHGGEPLAAAVTCDWVGSNLQEPDVSSFGTLIHMSRLVLAL
jgi:hypothetical protein